MTTLFLITARGGSKGVPGKNLRQLGGLSLIAWKARAAQFARRVIANGEYPDSRLVISTDSPEIANEARKHGVEVPFMRPAELATDTAQSADVIRHALANLGQKFNSVFLLEPSAPFATGPDLMDAYRKFCVNEADLVVGMKETDVHTSYVCERRAGDDITNIIMRMKSYDPDTRRQTRAMEWTMNGALYIFNPQVLEDGGDIYSMRGSIPPDETGFIRVPRSRSIGHLMDRWHSIEIDTPHDLEMAEYAVAKGYVKVPEPVAMIDKLRRFFGRGA